MSPPPGTVFLTRRASFSASHRYHRSEWSDEKNREVFGACSNPWGHGHNYVLEVTVRGDVDPETGMVLNLRDIDEVLREKVTRLFDHRYINEEVPGFRDTVPTTENIAVDIWRRLEGAFENGRARLHRVRLYETPELWVDYLGDEEGGGP